MATFRQLSQSETNANHRRVFEIIAQHEADTESTLDGYTEIALDASELTEVRDCLYSEVRENLTNDGAIQSAKELKESLYLKTKEHIIAALNDNAARNALNVQKGITHDGYFNPTSGIGTVIDPGMDTQSFIPVSITPQEATAYYANGGLPARIINKKAGCLSLDGVQFECKDFTADDLQRLEDYSNKCGFADAYAKAITEALIFGGSAVYPALTGDNPLRTQAGIHELLNSLPEKNFIRYWVNADRWNCVFTPEYNITAEDYLYTQSLFIPLGGCRVSTRRMAMVRPVKLPFWAAVKQMGWSTSDFEGWVKDFESYQIMKMSLPIMAQQMSLMYHSIPTDGGLAENGVDYAKEFFKLNEEQLRNWSMLHPKAINSVGDIKILERTYTGFQQLITESRLALCASAGVPESVLFAEKSTGLASDNEDDMTLKQSEAIRLLFNNVAPSFKNCIELLVYSCFGKNSEQSKYARTVTIKPDDGVILSANDKAQLGVQFSQIAAQLAGLGMSLESAVNIAHSCVPSVEIDDNTLQSLSSGEAENMDADLWSMFNAGRNDNKGGVQV